MNSNLPVPFGGIDAGGTKWACAIGTSPSDIRASTTIPTTSPSETLNAVKNFFGDWMEAGNPLAAVGVSSFGPLIRELNNPRWGCLYNAPKAGWEHAAIAPWIAKELRIPVGIDTDVNGAALAEHRWGAGADFADIAYLTIGTGVGGAIITNGELVTGAMHSEMGHFRPRRHVMDDYEGMCLYHTDCYEGLVSGPAIKDSTGINAEKLREDDEAWHFVAYYLGQLCASLIFTVSPRRIILGGGVMRRHHLIPMIRENVVREISGYLRWPTEEDIDDLIVHSMWNKDERTTMNAGVYGGFIIAHAALRHTSTVDQLYYKF